MIRYLSRSDVAKMIGVEPDSMSRYNLPPADAMIGTVRGWTKGSIEQWMRERPGRGARTDLSR